MRKIVLCLFLCFCVLVSTANAQSTDSVDKIALQMIKSFRDKAYEGMFANFYIPPF
jgi:negative regulator of sigma E activity